MNFSNRFKYALFSLILTVSLAGNTHAGSIPVIDVAHIAKTLQAYSQQLKDYKELILSNTLLDNQYVQMITDYQQVLKEYAHYLNQIKGLQNTISNSDWNALMNEISAHYGSFDPGLLPTMDTSSGTYHDDVRTILETYNLAPMKTTDALSEYNSLNVTALGADKTKKIEADFDRMNRTYERYANQQQIVAKNHENLEKFDTEKRKKLENDLRNLGDESDLATLQLIAAQQNVSMQQQKMLGEINNQQLQNYESISTFANSIEIEAYKEEIQRLKDVQGKPAVNGGVTDWTSLGL